MLRLHYVTGDHDVHVSGHCGQNLVIVRQRGGTGSTNVARCGRWDFFNLSRFATISHGPQGKLRNITCHFIGQ